MKCAKIGFSVAVWAQPWPDICSKSLHSSSFTHDTKTNADKSISIVHLNLWHFFCHSLSLCLPISNGENYCLWKCHKFNILSVWAFAGDTDRVTRLKTRMESMDLYSLALWSVFISFILSFCVFDVFSRLDFVFDDPHLHINWFYQNFHYFRNFSTSIQFKNVFN